jgi:hypothetical protein
MNAKINIFKLNIKELVNELQKQNLQKADFILPVSCLSMKEGKLVLTGDDEFSSTLKAAGIEYKNEPIVLDCLDTVHGHICDKLGIPRTYYNRMVDVHTVLRDDNVNHWLRNMNGNIMLRSFIDRENNTGYARALLSDRYSIMDNYDVLLACLSGIRESGSNIQIETGDITEKRLYLRFIAPDIEIQAPEILKTYRNPNTDIQNNGIISGFVVANSEVGHGAFSISPRAVILACSNGMIFKDDAFQKTHLGIRQDEGAIIWSKEIKTKNIELVTLQVKDALKTFISPEYLGQRIARLQDVNKPIKNVSDTIRNVSRELLFNEEKEKSILDYFIKGGDMTAMGVAQAVTFFAGNDASPDEQYDLEGMSVSIVENIDRFDKPVPKKTTAQQAVSN